MPDEILSQLCNICHAAQHKYKCPGCGARTCSLTCIKKHKSRTGCSGRHNPTDFVPREKLLTPAGIDHDYNFISAIDRAKQRAERDIIQELKLIKEDELRPKNEDKAFSKVWSGDQLTHVPIDPSERRGRRPPPIDSFDKHVRRRLRELDIEVRSMPKGMGRQKENNTSFNRRTLCIHWQVEWLLYGVPGFDQDSQPTRILHKVLDNRPLNKSLAASIEWQHGQLDRLRREQDQAHDGGEQPQDHDEEPRKNKKPNWKKKKVDISDPNQDPISGTWPTSKCALQYGLTGEWNQLSSAASVPLTQDEKAVGFSKWQFYLHHPSMPLPGGRKALIPLSSAETLADALTGRTIIEYPTLYVFPPLTPLPEMFVETSTERREKRKLDELDSDDPDRRRDTKKPRQERREPGERFAKEQRRPERLERFPRQQYNPNPRGRMPPPKGDVVDEAPPVMLMDIDPPAKAAGGESEEEGEIVSDREPVRMDVCMDMEVGKGGFQGKDRSAVSQPKGLVDYDSGDSD